MYNRDFSRQVKGQPSWRSPSWMAIDRQYSMKWAAVGRYRFHWKVSSRSSSMCSKPCLVRTRFMELMQPRLFNNSSFGTRSSLSSNLPEERNIWRVNQTQHHYRGWECEVGDTLTGQQETRERDNGKLRLRDIIAVHEEVQQVDAQVSGRGTQPEVVADDGYEVRIVSPQIQLRGLALVGRQLELLLEHILSLRSQSIKILTVIQFFVCFFFVIILCIHKTTLEMDWWMGQGRCRFITDILISDEWVWADIRSSIY